MLETTKAIVASVMEKRNLRLDGEMATTADSKSAASNSLRVQVPFQPIFWLKVFISDYLNNNLKQPHNPDGCNNDCQLECYKKYLKQKPDLKMKLLIWAWENTKESPEISNIIRHIVIPTC